MPFSLCNAFVIYSTSINCIFHEKSDEFVVVYINNILVFSKSEKKYKKYLEVVLKKLREEYFFLEELEFLKHVINGE